MDLHRFDLNLLVALDALLTERNVTQAGARLHLSQSAMSGALARLRSFFGDDLLVPVGRRMVLTPFAEQLVDPVRATLLQVRGTLAATPRFDPATANRSFSIAVSDYVTVVLMHDALQRARREAPNVVFELRPLGKQAVEDLESGELDFRIVPREFLSPGHPTDVLFEDTYTCVAWSGNQSIGDTISVEEYLSAGHVAVKNWTTAYDERFLQQANYRRRIEVWTSTFTLAPQLVVGTDRIATTTTRLALHYSRILPLKLVPLPVNIPPMVELVQWHRIRDEDPAFHWFRRVLKETVATLPDIRPVPSRRKLRAHK
jgi:LysR family nod box-dependent transcriptional activator